MALEIENDCSYVFRSGEVNRDNISTTRSFQLCNNRSTEHDQTSVNKQIQFTIDLKIAPLKQHIMPVLHKSVFNAKQATLIPCASKISAKEGIGNDTVHPSFTLISFLKLSILSVDLNAKRPGSAKRATPRRTGFVIVADSYRSGKLDFGPQEQSFIVRCLEHMGVVLQSVHSISLHFFPYKYQFL